MSIFIHTSVPTRPSASKYYRGMQKRWEENKDAFLRLRQDIRREPLGDDVPNNHHYLTGFVVFVLFDREADVNFLHYLDAQYAKTFHEEIKDLKFQEGGNTLYFWQELLNLYNATSPLCVDNYTETHFNTDFGVFKTFIKKQGLGLRGLKLDGEKVLRYMNGLPPYVAPNVAPAAAQAQEDDEPDVPVAPQAQEGDEYDDIGGNYGDNDDEPEVSRPAPAQEDDEDPDVPACKRILEECLSYYDNLEKVPDFILNEEERKTWSNVHEQMVKYYRQVYSAAFSKHIESEKTLEKLLMKLFNDFSTRLEEIEDVLKLYLNVLILGEQAGLYDIENKRFEDDISVTTLQEFLNKANTFLPNNEFENEWHNHMMKEIETNIETKMEKKEHESFLKHFLGPYVTYYDADQGTFTSNMPVGEMEAALRRMRSVQPRDGKEESDAKRIEEMKPIQIELERRLAAALREQGERNAETPRNEHRRGRRPTDNERHIDFKENRLLNKCTFDLTESDSFKFKAVVFKQGVFTEKFGSGIPYVNTPFEDAMLNYSYIRRKNKQLFYIVPVPDKYTRYDDAVAHLDTIYKVTDGGFQYKKFLYEQWLLQDNSIEKTGGFLTALNKNDGSTPYAWYFTFPPEKKSNLKKDLEKKSNLKEDLEKKSNLKDDIDATDATQLEGDKLITITLKPVDRIPANTALFKNR